MEVLIPSRVDSSPTRAHVLTNTHAHILSETGLLRRCVFKGELSAAQALADDYAFVCRAALDLYEATGKTQYLEWACKLQVRERRV